MNISGNNYVLIINIISGIYAGMWNQQLQNLEAGPSSNKATTEENDLGAYSLRH